MTESNIGGLIVLGIVAVIAVCVTVVRAIQTRARSRNIVAAGWPPPWLDADGNPQCAQKTELDAYVNHGKRP